MSLQVPDTVASILEVFSMLGTIFILMVYFYTMGKYQIFDRKLEKRKLSRICPQLDNIESPTLGEKEHKSIRDLLLKSLE